LQTADNTSEFIIQEESSDCAKFLFNNI